MPWGFEPLHAPLPLARRLVGMFRAVIQVPVLAVLFTGPHVACGRAITPQSVREDDPRHIRQPPEHPAEQRLRRHRVAATLHQDIEPVAVLIHGPPQVVTVALDRESDLVHVPRVSRPKRPAAPCMGVRLPERPAPIPHRRRGQDHAALGHQRFDVPVAQAEAAGELDTVADDLGREPMTLIQVDWWGWVHAASMTCKAGDGHLGE